MKATITLHPRFTIGAVDPRLFGGFAEHLGRCVYGGMYEPGHPAADEDGFRTDVLALIRELDMPVMRYPGGNFVSGYNWEDGVGPRAARPVRRDLAWKSTETNQFGTDEFAAWCHKANTAPMLAVNLGTRGPTEARDLLEYCNVEGGTAWSDLRRRNGATAPHGVKLWCLGNEVDGPWQMGHKTAAEYGRMACETAKLMKWTDPSIELVVGGSSGRGMSTFAAWEAEVLSHTYEHVDYVSIHSYYGNPQGDTPSFLAQPDEMGDFIDEVTACCDHVAAKLRQRRRMMLSFDEWNVWFHSHADREKRKIRDWAVAPPLLEDAYTAEDALVVGGMLITLLNHCDRVKIGCLAQIVNVIAPIMTQAGGPAWRQAIFYPFAQASALGRGVTLRQDIQSPTYDVADRTGVTYLHSASVFRPERDELVVFALNRSLDETLELSVDCRALGDAQVTEWQAMRHDDLKAVNTLEAPLTVAPAARAGASVTGGHIRAALEPASWNVIRARLARQRG